MMAANKLRLQKKAAGDTKKVEKPVQAEQLKEGKEHVKKSKTA